MLRRKIDLFKNEKGGVNIIMEIINLAKNIIVEDETGQCVYYEDIDSLDLGVEEEAILLSELKNSGVEIREKRGIVRNFNYGEFVNSPVPRIANIIYDENGEIVFEDYSELDKYLEKKFVPSALCSDLKKDDIGNVIDCVFYIPLNKILIKKFCDTEFKYIMNYLKDKDIFVRGTDSFLNGEFDNYQYCVSQKSYKDFHNVDPSLFLKDILEYRSNPTIEVRNKFIEKNMKIVSWIAFRYSFLTGIEIDELNSYGVEGLMLALERFDPSISSNFYSIATEYVKCNILKGIAEVQGYSSNMEFYNCYIKTKREVEKEKDECIEDNIFLLDEIIERMATKGIIGKKTIDDNKRRVLLRMCLSIDDYIDSMEVSDNNSLYYEVLSNECHELLNSSFEKISLRRVSVVKRHYGIGCEPMTFDEIAREENISHQAVAEIEKRVFGRIRTKKLTDIYNEFKNYDYNPNRIIECRGKTKKYKRS